MSRYHQIEALDLEQFQEILKIIHREHRFGLEGRMIKYISPYIDNRDMAVYRIHFTYGLGSEKEFTTVNPELNPLQGKFDNLWDAIMDWLNNNN